MDPRPLSASIPPAPSFRGRGDHPLQRRVAQKPWLVGIRQRKQGRRSPLPSRRVQTAHPHPSTSTAARLHACTPAHLHTEPSRTDLQQSTLETTRTAAARWRHHRQHHLARAPQFWAKGQFARRVQADRQSPLHATRSTSTPTHIDGIRCSAPSPSRAFDAITPSSRQKPFRCRQKLRFPDFRQGRVFAERTTAEREALFN